MVLEISATPVSYTHLSRKRGKGTIVLKRENTVATSFQSSFNGVEEKNNANDRRVISVEYATPPIDVAYFFGVSVNRPVLKLSLIHI